MISMIQMEFTLCCLLLVVLCLLLLGFFATIHFYLPSKIHCDFHGKHVLITGGSKGLGKAIAKEALLRGCKHISIVARDKKGLDEALNELEVLCNPSQQVHAFKCDLTSGYVEIRRLMESVEASHGPIDILINNAGFVVQGGFEELDPEAFEAQLRINYLSAAHTTRAVIGQMKERGRGHVAFVSSAAGQCAIWGYTAYSPSKFALRGLAEALHMELLPYNVGVSILYPPNTATEGFAQEVKGMPPEVKEISSSAGIFNPTEVARRFISALERGEFAVTIGLEGWMLGVLTVGAAPQPSLMPAVVQILLMGLFRGVMLVYLGGFNHIVKRCKEEKKEKIAM